MTSIRKHTIWAGLVAIAAQIGAQTFADEITDVIEVVERAAPEPVDPDALVRAEAEDVLAILATEQADKLRESTMDSYGQLVSELEMYDDGTRVADTVDAGQTEDQPAEEQAQMNFAPRS